MKIGAKAEKAIEVKIVALIMLAVFCCFVWGFMLAGCIAMWMGDLFRWMFKRFFGSHSRSRAQAADVVPAEPSPRPGRLSAS
jgi:CDP-diglyceride synthetase